MEEIEVVINITKHEWEYLNKLVENGDQLGHHERLLVNGTPLPKGHGNLKDEDEIYELLNSINGTAELDKAFEAVEQATTFIKADKEDENE